MSSLLPQFLHVGTLLLGVFVVVATKLIRVGVEGLFPQLQKLADENASFATYASTISRYWNQVFLYAIPVAVGSGAAMVSPFTLGFTSLDSKAIGGLLVGWLMSFLYKLAKRRWDRPAPTVVLMPTETVTPVVVNPPKAS